MSITYHGPAGDKSAAGRKALEHASPEVRLGVLDLLVELDHPTATALLEPPTPPLRRLEQVGGRRFWSQLEAERELAVGSAVVTGGGRGMGGAIARELHARGYALAVMSPSESAGQLAGERSVATTGG